MTAAQIAALGVVSEALERIGRSATSLTSMSPADVHRIKLAALKAQRHVHKIVRINRDPAGGHSPACPKHHASCVCNGPGNVE